MAKRDTMTALDSIRLVDMITTLANFSFSGNTSRMVRDGAAAALVSLVHGFRERSDQQKQQNGRLSFCAYAAVPPALLRMPAGHVVYERVVV